jgi:hypothetical protein
MSKHVLAALSSALFTLAWWKASVLRGVRTAVVIVIPYVGTVILFKDVDWLTIVSAAGLGFVASLITSLAGIPEADGKKVSIWVALVERTVKTVAQALVVGIGNAVLFTDVNWSNITQAALIAGLGSLLLGVLGYLPEASEQSVTRAPVKVSLTADAAQLRAYTDAAVEARTRADAKALRSDPSA